MCLCVYVFSDWFLLQLRHFFFVGMCDNFWIAFWLNRCARQLARDGLACKTLATSDLPDFWSDLQPSTFLLAGDGGADAAPKDVDSICATELQSLLPMIHEWRNESIAREEIVAYVGKDLVASLSSVNVGTLERDKVCFELADKVGRAITQILSDAPVFCRDKLGLLLEFCHSPTALRIVATNVESLAASKGVLELSEALLSLHQGHPSELLGQSFNPWQLIHSRLKKLDHATAANELRAIAVNSDCFLVNLRELGYGGGLAGALWSATAVELETVFAKSHGWGSFRAKNALRFRQPTTTIRDSGRYKSDPVIVLCGQGPRRIVSHRMGTTVFTKNKRGNKVRKVAALALESAPGLQLWSVLLRIVGSKRAAAFTDYRRKNIGRGEAVKRILRFCEPVFLSDYGLQFSFCEESKIMSLLTGCDGEEDEVDPCESAAHEAFASTARA